MSNEIELPNLGFDYEHMSDQAKRAIRKARLEAERRGLPLAYLAQQFAKEWLMKKVDGSELVGGQIAENALKLGVNLARDPDGFVSPKTGRLLLVKVRESKATGDMLREEVQVHNLKCTRCKSTADKRGWELEPAPGEPTHIAWCSNCYHYLWFEAAPTDSNGEG